MITQLIAATLTAVMHYYFGISLLITLPECKSGMLCLANFILLTSVTLFLTRIKLCPNNKTGYYVLSIVETIMFLAILEVSVGFTVSFKHTLGSMIGTAFPQLCGSEKMVNLTDTIIMSLACAMFFTALLDMQVIHKAAEYISTFKNPQTFKECPKVSCDPKSQYPEATKSMRQTTKYDETLYFNPQCPCHGNASWQTKC